MSLEPMVVPMTVSESVQQVDMTVSSDQKIHFDVTMEIRPIYTDVPLYEGDYEVTPNTEEQTLPTSDKRMEDDVTVHAIPYYETTNESGGYTVIIG
jgi:hypothetical protein